MTTTTITRRTLLKTTAVLAGGTVLGHVLPASVADLIAQQAAPPADPVAAIRAQMGATPIERLALADNLTMLSGPGGNVVVLNGADGKIVVDGFVQPAWASLKQALDAMGPQRITTLINTHWHFDHSDNNANFREAGAAVLAHENTRRRLSETHELLGMRFPPAPANALPTQTFADSRTLQANGDTIELGYIPPSHTDTDISIRYTRANVLHLGDTFFNGMYPVIDGGTGGSITGMIAAADRSLKMADARTRIVPGHGPVGDRAALERFRDMMVDVRDRVQKLKTSGRTLEEAVAARPTAPYDDPWGKGFLTPDQFVTFVYATL
ncbi:MAG: MBL fold metallo-hydrolase [Acidobacteria bacterium]|nr:MBL fold metallo-hydrolase [Acidobacteriota bacterium]